MAATPEDGTKGHTGHAVSTGSERTCQRGDGIWNTCFCGMPVLEPCPYLSCPHRNDLGHLVTGTAFLEGEKLEQRRWKLRTGEWCHWSVLHRTQMPEDLVACLFLSYQRHIVKLVNGKEKCLRHNVIPYVRTHLCMRPECPWYGREEVLWDFTSAFFAVFILGRVWKT